MFSMHVRSVRERSLEFFRAIFPTDRLAQQACSERKGGKRVLPVTMATHIAAEY